MKKRRILNPDNEPANIQHLPPSENIETINRQYLPSINVTPENTYQTANVNTQAVSIKNTTPITCLTTNENTLAVSINTSPQQPNLTQPDIQHNDQAALNEVEDLPLNENPVYLSIPYIPQLSEGIAQNLKRDYNIKIAYRTTKTLNNVLPKVKDRIPTADTSNVVYRISCANCDMSYIGMTKNKLHTRISGHKSDVNKYIKLRNTTQREEKNEIERMKEKTALLQHTIELDHMFDFTNTMILDRTNHSPNLNVLETCHIATSSNTVNYRKDVDGLSIVYGGILHTLKSIKNRSTVPRS